MYTATPVLLLTHDDFLWQHWRRLDEQCWMLARGRDFSDLCRWREQGRTVVVIDTGLPDWDTQTWQPMFSGMQAIVASVRPDDAEGVQVFTSGVLGYCHAYAPVDTLSHVLHAVVAGSVWMGESLVNRLLRQVATHVPVSTDWRHQALTDRECVIAMCIAQGDPNRKIATAMGISERTVKAHLTSIFSKLNIKDRLQLALLVHGIKQ